MLENGDLRSCIKYLNRKNKTKVSLVLSQSVSNTAAMNALLLAIQQRPAAPSGVNSVLEFVTGQS